MIYRKGLRMIYNATALMEGIRPLFLFASDNKICYRDYYNITDVQIQ